MKPTVVILLMSLLLLANAGCEPADTKISTRDERGLSLLAEYSPTKVDVMPLTEFISDGGSITLTVHVCLLDKFDSQIKSPAVFRFELYNKVPRSAKPKGKRVSIWPDVNLNNVDKNSQYWQDFLRSYKFDLPFELDTEQDYILQVTAMCPNGRRLSTEFTLKSH